MATKTAAETSGAVQDENLTTDLICFLGTTSRLLFLKLWNT